MSLRHGRLFRLGLIFGAWTLVVVAVVTHCCVYGALFREDIPISIFSSFGWAALKWYSWALVTPLVLWLARRYRLDRMRFWRNLTLLLASSIAVLAFMMGLHCLYEINWFQGGWSAIPARKIPLIYFRQLPENLLALIAMVILWYLVEHYRRYRDHQLKAAQLEAQLGQAQVEALKMQLQPHFMFNTLNTISAMIKQAPERAEEMIAWTSELLRMSLDKHKDQEVPLFEELAFLEKYLQIQQVRFGDRLKVQIDVDSSVRSALVPNLLLQPLMENAFKHGVSTHSGPAQVELCAWRDGPWLRLQVKDNGPGLVHERRSPAWGIGLSNTHARLDGLYGERYRLDYLPGDPRGMVMDLRLPFRGEQKANEPSHEASA